MFTRIKNKIKGKWNRLLGRSFDPKTGGKYLFFEGNEENYISNGAWLLEESISLFHGKANPIRLYSANELNNMKLEMVPNFYLRGMCVYQGSWEGRVVYVTEGYGSIGEIVVGTQMATHNNSHKILGCCLETEYAVLVYEWVVPKTLEDYLIPKNEKDESERVVLEWKDRIRIAWEISHCISYLHTAFRRPIIHRDIKASNVFLDMDNSAKLSDYSVSVSIPEGEEFVTESLTVLPGTLGYADDQYFCDGKVRECIDVYSFGMLLLVLLSGKKAFCSSRDRQHFMIVNLARDCIKNKCINDIIDPVITTNGVTTFEDFQIQTALHLALRCSGPQEERPTMEEVAIQLKNIITKPESISLPNGHQ